MRIYILMTLLMTLSVQAESANEQLIFAMDGWHTWRVEAIAEAPNWCCAVWRNDQVISKSCELDSNNHSYGAFDNGTPANKNESGEMQIYARIVKGQTTDIRTLSPDCSVSASTNIRDHGKPVGDHSINWLATQIDASAEHSSDALAAIAVHAGKSAFKVLDQTAIASPHIDHRKDALFWMGQVRAQESQNTLNRSMFSDALKEIREHAVFSVSQSNLSGKATSITKVGTSDSSPDVRGKAWFWLAQTKDPVAAKNLLRAISAEASEQVRDEAIFAASQLPDKEAVDTLITIARNQRLPHSARKRALFWLAHSDSDLALSYLSSLLE